MKWATDNITKETLDKILIGTTFAGIGVSVLGNYVLHNKSVEHIGSVVLVSSVAHLVLSAKNSIYDKVAYTSYALGSGISYFLSEYFNNPDYFKYGFAASSIIGLSALFFGSRKIR